METKEAVALMEVRLVIDRSTVAKARAMRMTEHAAREGAPSLSPRLCPNGVNLGRATSRIPLSPCERGEGQGVRGRASNSCVAIGIRNCKPPTPLSRRATISQGPNVCADTARHPLPDFAGRGEHEGRASA